MSVCSVRMCDTVSEQDTFDFPVNEAQQRKWWHFLKVCNGKVDKSLPSKICSRHFKPSEVLKGFSVTLLVPGAVPTIAVIKKNDIEEIGTKPGVTIQPKIYEPATIVHVKKSKAISQVCKETGMCGSCLLVTGTPMKKISMAAAVAFKEITEFETLSDFICDSCTVSLRNFIVFKSLVKQKHKQIRDDLERSNFMGKRLEDIMPSNVGKGDPISKFCCRRCDFRTATSQLLRLHESSKHSICSEQQQPFQKIQIQVADEDYDFMAQILNRNQLQQVKITENSGAANEEGSSSMSFKIAKVDSWAQGEPGPSKPRGTCVKKRKKKNIIIPTIIPPNADNDALGNFRPNSDLIMQYAQNYRKLEEFVDDEIVQPKKPKKRRMITKQPQRHHGNQPFYCDLCGQSSNDRDALTEHMHQAHPGNSIVLG